MVVQLLQYRHSAIDLATMADAHHQDHQFAKTQSFELTFERRTSRVVDVYSMDCHHYTTAEQAPREDAVGVIAVQSFAKSLQNLYRPLQQHLNSHGP